MTINKCPTVDELNQARIVYWEKIPQDLFYRVATELITLTIRGKTTISLAEAISVLLQTWNGSYYRFHTFDNDHFNKIEGLINKQGNQIITSLRPRSILSLCDDDKPIISEVFNAFENILGKVGAVKSMHLLAPSFFPLLDDKIAKGYKINFGKAGTNADNYWDFMKLSVEQCKTLNNQISDKDNLLKRIDEYNYCHYTRGWI